MNKRVTHQHHIPIYSSHWFIHIEPQPYPYPFQEDGEDSDSDSGRSTVAGEEQFELLDLWRANEMLGETVKQFGNETVFDYFGGFKYFFD